MKKNILTILVSISLVTTIIPIPATNTWSSKLNSFIVFPEEPSLDTPLVPNQNGLIQLDEERICQLSEKIQQNFTRRSQLSYGSLALKATIVGIGLYQLGFLNFILPAPKGDDQSEALKTRITALENMVKILAAKAGISPIASAADVPRQGRLEWLLNGTKSIAQFATIGVVTAKLLQINNYIEAQPTMDYFSKKHLVGEHNLLDYIALLHKTVKAAANPLDDDIESSAYHKRAVAPMVESIAVNLERLIAFTEYYFSLHDEELVKKHALEDVSRRIFNVSNTFLRKMHEQLQKPLFEKQVIAIVEDLRDELVGCIKKCIIFERVVQAN